MKRDKRGISPIVATLMLVLITVAAAVAFYMFETGWQKTATSNVGDGTVSSTQLTMSGSTTVTDLMNTMVPAFEQNNSGFKVSYTGTGSGAGLIDIEKGKVSMGMISDDMNAITAGTTAAYPNLVATTIAYDGVSVFAAATTMTYHGITGTLDMNQTLIDGLYGANGATPYATWGAFEAALTASGPHNAACVGVDAHAGLAINVHYRSDSSGTQDAFCDKALAAHKFLPYSNPTATQIGENGNPAMVTDVLADTNGIGFATTGMVNTNSAATGFTWNGVSATYAHIIASVNGQATKHPYAIWHPLEIVTNGVPVTEAKSFIDWINSPDNNIVLCHKAGFCSAYESA